MCGISGIINDINKTCQVKDLLAMTDIISHRGPDGEGYLLFDEQHKAHVLGGKDTPAGAYLYDMPYRPSAAIQTYHEKFTVALGHRRLSIIDLSPLGHVPMSYCNGRYWITFNGEIYNYQAIRKQLELLGHTFISHTDTEVILAAYSQWGESCLHHFHGMWAFAIYDTVTEEIFLARDRFGIKPLYYWAAAGGGFCFGSEIKQFTTLPGWKAILNKQKAYDFLVYNMADHTDETMFERVFQIPPGHFFKSKTDKIITGETGKIVHEKWYKPVYKGYNGTFEDAAKDFKKHFKESVKEHLIADVPVGAALSGGLDSSAIVCEVNELLKEEGNQHIQKTFSYCADDVRYNERKWMDEVTSWTNVEANYVSSSGDSVFKHSEELIWHMDEPNQSQSELATWEIYKAAKDNDIKVLMSGQGADEYISGYEGFSTFRWLQLLKKLKFKMLNNEITQNQPHQILRIVKAYFNLMYFFVPRRIRRVLSRKTEYYKLMMSLVSLENLQAKEHHPFDSIPYEANSIFNIAHKQLLHYPLPKYLHFDDRLSMSNSVEARVPFLDHRLVEFTTQLPADYLDGMGNSKKIMKFGLKDILPEKIRNRKDKIGFITAEERWVKESHTDKFRKMLEISIKNSKGLIKPEAIHYFDKLCKGEIPFDYTYWRLIAFGIWMKKFEVGIE